MAGVLRDIGEQVKDYAKSIPSAARDSVSNLLSNSDFVSRTVGMSNSYEDIMIVVQALGREPISLLGKDFVYIFDHVRRNYGMGTNVMDYHHDCPKFTFYKERPTVRFANPFDDPMNLVDRWFPYMDFGNTMYDRTLFSYAESTDDTVENKEIAAQMTEEVGNKGVNKGGVASFANAMSGCDLLKKTNDNFNYGKYRTLIARFHTNSEDSKDPNDPKQTAISIKYGMSHGRNLLRKDIGPTNGYNNPYCRVWTYHHQYNQLNRAIRPFKEADGADVLEDYELTGLYHTVGFRTKGKEGSFDGGSARLDKYGVLDYNTGMVNIAPTAKLEDYFRGTVDEKVSIKKCMFSIENLAWRADGIIRNEFDPNGLSPEQKGPLGGRIMWFPPYDIQFNESVSVRWNENEFIGRGEKVFTYTNTDRRGNLSFMLLIDHPSILDYWSGHDKEGRPYRLTNRNKPLLEGNNGGVDEQYNQENTLLRFFAGCDILSAVPQEYRKKKREPKPDGEPQPVVATPPDPEVHSPTVKKKVIQCALYYPNNYSGADDYPIVASSSVNSIYYLMNGIGAQKYVNTQGLGDKFYGPEDIPTTISVRPTVSRIQGDTVSRIQGDFGGYEVGSNISIAKSNIKNDYNTIRRSFPENVIESAPKRITGEGRVAEYLTDEQGTHYKVTYVSDYYLAKMVSDSALPLKEVGNPNWHKERWYYRVDKVYVTDDLTRRDSYLDTVSFQLNEKYGYQQLKNNKTVYDGFGFAATSDDVRLISFADLFVAVEGTEARNLLVGKFDADNVACVENIINDTERYKVTGIKIEGHASLAGRVSSNKTLAKNRARTPLTWLREHNFPNINVAKDTDKLQDPTKNHVDSGRNSQLVSKLWRSASIIIEYEETTFENAALSNSSEVAKNDGGEILVDNETKAVVNRTDKVSTNLRDSDAFKDVMRDVKLIMAPHDSSVIDKARNASPSDLVPEGVNPWTGVNQKTLNEQVADLNLNVPVEQPTSVSWEDEEKDIGDNEKIGVVKRYDNEGEFFESIKRNDPFLHHLITDKIRYFDPAYHSISPEGFGARLTFLHQCTRQGSTVGASDNVTLNTAYNLAFGRPPVCVLRLGDFYNTKIVIHSINIQYDSPQWDLNPEGIGVMPMFAKVSMDFSFIGGSDLAGPISRLQNAVSFNYYANTGVYDNRAEMVEYDPDGTGREIKFKAFSYPDMLHKSPRKFENPTAETEEGFSGHYDE